MNVAYDWKNDMLKQIRCQLKLVDCQLYEKAFGQNKKFHVMTETMHPSNNNKKLTTLGDLGLSDDAKRMVLNMDTKILRLIEDEPTVFVTDTRLFMKSPSTYVPLTVFLNLFSVDKIPNPLKKKDDDLCVCVSNERQ